MIGSLFILATPKHFQKANDLSPNLFRQNRESRSPYYYAIYDDKKLSVYSSKYSFATGLDASQIPADEITKKKPRATMTNYGIKQVPKK